MRPEPPIMLASALAATGGPPGHTSRSAPAATYRHDMRRAWHRINSFPTQELHMRLGIFEHAD